MKLKLYALKDLKVGYMNVIQEANDDVARRNFRNLLTDPTPNVVNRNPGDYEMWRIGTYDNESGEVVSDLSFICNASTERSE